MRRRDFIAALSRAAAAWPLAARAQQPQRVRRIAIISMTGPNDRGGTFLAAFEDELTRLGWTPGRDLEIDRLYKAVRW